MATFQSGNTSHLKSLHINKYLSKQFLFDNLHNVNLLDQTPKAGLQALVFGASGITGWAITNSALSYPTPTAFSRIIGLTSRPLSQEASGFPSDSRLQLYSGLDLSQDAATIEKYLKNIENVDQITHVYFAGTIHHIGD